MANEIQFFSLPSKTVYGVVTNLTGQFWNTSGTPAFEAYNKSHWANYAVALTEQSSPSGVYLANFPSGIASGSYTVTFYNQVGGSAASTDLAWGSGSLSWNGTAAAAASFDSSGNVKSSPQTSVTASSVTDKTGYALTAAEHTAISGTDVPSAMNSMGYTTTRAGYLDTLNGLVAAIWSFATRTITAQSDSSGVLTLLTRVAQTLMFDSGGNVKSAPQSTAAIDSAIQSDVVNGLNSQGYTAANASLMTMLPGISTQTGRMHFDSSDNLNTVIVGDKTGIVAQLQSAINSVPTATAVAVLASPANKIVTDPNGAVTVGTNLDKSGYQLSGAEHTQIVADSQLALTSLGLTSARANALDLLDVPVSSRLAATSYVAPDNADILKIKQEGSVGVTS